MPPHPNANSPENEATKITDPEAIPDPALEGTEFNEETTGLNAEVDDNKTVIPGSEKTVIGPTPDSDQNNSATFNAATGLPNAAQPTGDGSFSFDSPTSIGDAEADFSGMIPDEQSAIGTQIGDYVVTDELGRGGMGVVYKARHEKLNRDVALKMILTGIHTSKQHLERFTIEARAVAALQHPNIVQLFDIGEHDGLPYFTLEFVDGEDLANVLKGEPQTPKSCAEIVETLARAMHYAHGEGIVHRDLKPANVLQSNDGALKITDFGLARDLDDDSHNTRSGTVMGSPSYMSPEQASGKNKEVGPLSDQYSLGAVLYQLITARAPFAAAKSIDTITQVVKNDPIPPRKFQPEVPVDLETICLKTLQKDPAARYANCEEFAADLRRYLNGEPILARPISPLASAWKWCKRNPRVAIPSVASAVLLITTAAVALISWATVSAANTALNQANKEVKEKNEQITQKNEQITQEKEKEQAARVVAEENEQRAIKQANLALQMFQKIIERINPKLASRPKLQDLRLEIMREIGTQWNELDATVRDDELSQSVPTRMAAELALMQIYMELGEYPPAEKLAKSLLETARHRVQLRDGTSSARNNLAAILLNVSNLRGQVDTDRRLTAGYLLEAQKICQDILDNPKKGPDGKQTHPDMVRIMQAAITQNLAVAFMFEGRLKEAQKSQQDSLRLYQEMIEKYRDNAKLAEGVTRWRLEEARVVIAMANVMLRLEEEPDEALRLYRDAYDKMKTVATENPDHTQALNLYAGIHGFQGEAWHWSGQHKPANEKLTESVKQYEKLYQANPNDVGTKRNYAMSLYRLGCLLDDTGEEKAALEHFEKAKTLRAELVETHGFKFLQHHMQSLARCGDVAAARKIAEELDEMTEAASEDRKQLESGFLWKKPNASVHVLRAQALAQVARHVPAAEKPAAINDAFRALDQAIENGYRDPYKIRVHADFKPLQNDARFKDALKRIAAATENEVN